MFDILDFEEVFDFDPECSYDEDAVKKIEAHRKDLEGLFVDRVMKLLGIKRPAKFYPPKTNGDLRALHHTIVESNGADHHKIAILHYILQEFDYVNGNRLIANSFEERAYLPKRYVTYMKGLWHLDRAEFEDALQYLTHPSLIPTFADEILELLVKKAKKQDLTLALAYYQTVQPAVTSQRALECLFMAIARTSVTEAFYLSRGQPSFTRRHMFEMLIAAVLNNSTSDTVADRGVELIKLPLSDEEEVWFEEYLLRGEGKALRKGKDTVMMRRIGTGKFTESLSMKGSNSNRAIGGLDWSNLSAAVQDGLGPRVHV